MSWIEHNLEWILMGLGVVLLESWTQVGPRNERHVHRSPLPQRWHAITTLSGVLAEQAALAVVLNLAICLGMSILSMTWLGKGAPQPQSHIWFGLLCAPASLTHSAAYNVIAIYISDDQAEVVTRLGAKKKDALGQNRVADERENDMQVQTTPSLSQATYTNAPPRFHLLAKPSGSTCNLDCTYCFFLSKEALYPNEKSRMSEATLEAYIRQLLESHRTPTVTVAWQGGEPTLMGLDFFKSSVEFAQQASAARTRARVHLPDQRRAAGRRLVRLSQGTQLPGRAQRGRPAGDP